ncbi:MAG: DUF6502 family protein [Pseudomonadota bacterium]
MKYGFENVVHQACRVLLRPIASMLLRTGLTWKEFSDLAKSVFVEVATEEFGINGRPTNVSRVSILTGISRKEVKRQRDLLESGDQSVTQKTTDATRVLSGWFQDAEFLDESGKPASLSLESENGGVSFELLCKRYGGDIAPQTMLKELLTTETIKRNASGEFYPTRRYYQPGRHDDENLLWAVNMIRDLTTTMNNNVFKTDETLLRFGGKAENHTVRADCTELFRAFLDQRGQAFLEDIDDWLTRHAEENDNENTECVRLGVGLFAIEDSS